MPIYALKRLLAMIPTMFGITFVTFLIINLAPGDPVATSFGAGEGLSSGGSGQSQARLADTIKAKKKLLGILAEDHAMLGWRLPGPDKELSVLEAPSGAPLAELVRSERLGDLGAWPTAMAGAPDRDLFYVGTRDGRIRAFDDRRRGAAALLFEGHETEVLALTVSRDGNTLVSGDGRGAIRVWDTRTGQTTVALPELGKPVRALAMLPNGSAFLSACDDGRIRLHATQDGGVKRTFDEHIAGVYALAVSPDGKRFWSGGYDRTLRVWSLETYTSPGIWGQHGQAINAIALSPKGDLLATGCDDRIIRVFSTAADARPLLALQGHVKRVTALVFSGDGKTLVSGGDDETLYTWDLETGRRTASSRTATGPVHALLVSRSRPLVWSASEAWTKVPLYQRYWKWLGRVVTLDFDRSFVDNRPVIEKIEAALPVTLGLNALALLIIYMVAIPIGIMSAVRRGRAFDHIASVVLFVLYSIPNFWAATMLILMFSSRQNWDILPSVGLQPENPFNLSFFQWLGASVLHLVLPVTVLVYTGFASLSQYARTSMLETIGQDYIRTARAKGLPEWLVVYKHALRNALITIVTLVANLLPALIGGSVIVEYIFSIHGMGKLGFDAIISRDYPVIMAIATFSAFLTLLGILLSDLLYRVVDPRMGDA